MNDVINKIKTPSIENKGVEDTRIIFFSLLVSFAYFFIQAYLFPTQFRPDEEKAIDVFSLVLIGREFDAEAEFYIRALLFLFNVLMVVFLAYLKLVDRKTLMLAASWPLTVFMFSKIYWEFYVFPLYLIRINTSIKEELFVILFLIILYTVTAESNLLVFLAFRSVLFLQKIGLKLSAPIGFIALGMAINLSFESGVHKLIPILGSELERFSWTREVANPEYSIFETVAVFLSSMHFFTIHTGLWWIDLLFSLVVVFVVISKSSLTTFKFVKQPEILAFISILFTMTEITHVFQNARYYLFFLPVLSMMITQRTIGILAWIGLFHVILKAVEVI